MSDTVSRGSSAVARRHMSRRCAPLATAGGRCGGVPVGTKTTWSRSAHSIAASAAATCPRCTGSKVPPSTPSLKAGSPQNRRFCGVLSRLVLELGRSDAYGVAGLHAGRLERRVDTDPVELHLEAFERAVRVEVGSIDQALDALAAHPEAPR